MTRQLIGMTVVDTVGNWGWLEHATGYYGGRGLIPTKTNSKIFSEVPSPIDPSHAAAILDLKRG